MFWRHPLRPRSTGTVSLTRVDPGPRRPAPGPRPRPRRRRRRRRPSRTLPPRPRRRAPNGNCGRSLGACPPGPRTTAPPVAPVPASTGPRLRNQGRQRTWLSHWRANRLAARPPPTHTRTRAHTHTHARTHAHSRTHTPRGTPLLASAAHLWCLPTPPQGALFAARPLPMPPDLPMFRAPGHTSRRSPGALRGQAPPPPCAPRALPQPYPGWAGALAA